MLTLSGRHDWADTDTENLLTNTTTKQDDTELTGRTGLVYLFDFGLAPYVGYSTSFQPTVGTNVQGEPFEPTTAKQQEVGIRYQPPTLNALIAVTGFNLVRENVQTADPANPQNRIQTGEVRSRGFEFEANASLDFGLNVNAAYTFQDVEITESTEGDEGNRLAQVPKHEVSAWADYSVQEGPLVGLGFGAGIRYRWPTFASNANNLKVDGATLVDAALSYQWHALSFEVHAENLFDNKHVSSCSGASACFFGSERTVIGAVRYRW